ncbi:hypothetical protein V9K67_26815 [Paraflavisolibacter sp. H34]|uniref:hypothetical protein n=1 Tax=Huijunlia imazamoxiresistens TaxID=3127457 RepID=UPI003017264D
MLHAFFQWWARLQGFEQVLWGIALLFSFLFLVQTTLSFFVDAAHDHNSLGDTDTGGGEGDGHGFQFFSPANLITFFTLFGWAGLAAYHSGLSTGWVIAIGAISGYFMVVLLYFLLKWIVQLRQSGTLQMGNALSQVGETYLRIPAGRQGTGKIHIQVQGRLSELDAMTDDSEDIATGKPVKVTGILNDHILLVTTDFLKY